MTATPEPDAAGHRQQTQQWLETQSGMTVQDSTPLLGGMSSVVERHRLADGSHVVTRHITDAEWLAREPQLIAAEADALRLLAGSPIAVPELIA